MSLGSFLTEIYPNLYDLMKVISLELYPEVFVVNLTDQKGSLPQQLLLLI